MVYCTPLSTNALYQAVLMVSAGSSLFSYSISCDSQALVSFDYGPASFGIVSGGVSISRQLMVQNQAAVAVAISLSIVVDSSASTVGNRRRAATTLGDSWVSYSDTATVSLSPGGFTLAPSSEGKQLVLLSLVPLLPFAHSFELQFTTSFTVRPVTVAQLDWYAVAPILEFENNRSVIDLGLVPVGSSHTGSVAVSNLGNSAVDLTGLLVDASSNSWLSVSASLVFPFQVLANEDAAIMAKCTPTNVGSFATTATLTSSSYVSPEVSILISCIGTATCRDGYQNQGETGIDCGGPCAPCSSTVPAMPQPPPPSSAPLATELAPPVTVDSQSSAQEQPAVASANNATHLPPPPASLPLQYDQPVLPLDSRLSTQTISSTVVQPLATDGSSTTVVVFSQSGRSASVTVSSGAGAGGATALIVGPAAPSMLATAAQLSSVHLGSLAIDVSLSNGTSQLASAAQLCFSIDPTTNYKSACLGYIDSSGRWQCEDKCLSNSNATQLCGSTGHFTNFAVLLSGGGGRQCDSYITGSWRGDLALAASVAGFIILLSCVVLALGCSTPGRLLLAGPEGRRILQVRNESMTVQSLQQDTSSFE